MEMRNGAPARATGKRRAACASFVPGAKRHPYLFLKRAADVVLSLFFLVLLALPMAAVALWVKTGSRGAAIFRQERIGRDLRPFRCLKFRTMDECGRVTAAGRFLRRSSIDELPQLLNVLRGDMSLVGYRPVVPGETELIGRRAAGGVYRLRPGLTGLAQINGRDLLGPAEKAELDRQYTETVSASLDLWILWRTVGCVWHHTGICEHGENAGNGLNGEQRQGKADGEQ